MKDVFPYALVGIWVSALLVSINCFGLSRHFMKMAGLVHNRDEVVHLPPDIMESRRRDMSAFQRSALFANLAGSAILFLALVSALIFSAVVFH